MATKRNEAMEQASPDSQWKPKVNPWIIASTVALAAFMEVLDTSIANVALPHISGSLGASTEASVCVHILHNHERSPLIRLQQPEPRISCEGRNATPKRMRGKFTFYGVSAALPVFIFNPKSKRGRSIFRARPLPHARPSRRRRSNRFRPDSEYHRLRALHHASLSGTD